MFVRGLIFFAGLAALSAVGAWLAGNPGEVTILTRIPFTEKTTVRVDTSVGVLLLAAGLLAAAAAILYRIWGGLWNVPRQLGRARRERRLRRGHLALARGMVAVAAGDTHEARRQARRADELLDDPPLTLLLAAQAAQLEGDEAAAETRFTAMLERPETEFVGLRGLMLLAQRHGDAGRALDLARRARLLKPELPWVQTTLFELEVTGGLWPEAERTLKAMVRHKTLPPAEIARKTAVVLLERSLDAERHGTTSAALASARKAQAADPGFLPATLRLAWLHHGAGRDRRAQKLIEDSWRLAPHPELARLYRLVAPAKDALRALQAMETLEKLQPGHRESHLALARASLDAQLWGEARRHVKQAGEPLTAGICRLMAELVDAEGGDAGAAREWLARATEAEPDPAWVCGACGAVAEDWSAHCGNCGAFDRLDWRIPARVRALAPAEAAEAAETAAVTLPPRPAPPPPPLPVHPHGPQPVPASALRPPAPDALSPVLQEHPTEAPPAEADTGAEDEEDEDREDEPDVVTLTPAERG